MASIDLSVLPRLIGVLEDLPNISALRLKVATLETQLQEKQQVIEDLQAHSLPVNAEPEIAAMRPSLDAPIIEALQERLKDALELVDKLKAENQWLKSQVETLSQHSALVPFAYQPEDYIAKAKTASRHQLDLIVCHGVGYMQLWPKFVGYLTITEVYSLARVSDFWRVNVCMDPSTLEHLAFIRPQAAIMPGAEDPPALDESGRQLIEK